MEQEVEFPLSLSSFIRKRDAAYDGDPNGDYVKADDVNELQESIERIEQAIGIDKLQLPVIRAIQNKADKSSVAAFGSPLFINYNGSSISTYRTIEERINAFSYIPHVMVKKEESPSFDYFIQEVKRSGTSLYGIVICSSIDANTVESQIIWFKSKGFDGVVLTGFGLDDGWDRTAQNYILDVVHSQGLVAVVTGDIQSMLFNKPHKNNPLQENLRTAEGDIFLAQNIFVVNNAKNDPALITSLVFDLNRAQKEKGVKIFVEDSADISADKNTLYLYGKLLSTLYNLDGYSLSPKSRYSLNEKVEKYLHGFELGQWQTESPIFVEDAQTVSRSFSKGSIVFDKVKNQAYVEGISLDPTVYTWQDKQIPGTAVDLAKADYNSEVTKNVVDAINENDHLIHFSKIDGLNGDGSNPDAIKDIVVRAINNSPAATTKHPPNGYDEIAGNDFIHGGVIDYIDAGSIKSGELHIDRIKTNIIEAINAYIGTAKIDKAFIGELSANHIASNVVDAINIYAANAGIDRAHIDQAVIGELSADHIKASVISAINASIGEATIDAAKIGELTADNIKANVISAINASVGNAVIDSAKIGTLTADHIKGMVVEAVNMYAGEAKIDAAQIGELAADNIRAGLVEAFQVSATSADFDTLQAAVINAINASVKQAFIDGAIIKDSSIGTAQIANGSITDAKIVDLTAAKIKSGTIDTSLVNLEGPNSRMKIMGNRLQVFDDQEIPVERISLGDVNGDGTEYGFRVRGADGTTILLDQDGVRSEGITDGAITNKKIEDSAVDNRTVRQNSLQGDRLVVDAITAREIASKTITANEIATGAITAGSAIIAEGAIGEAEIAEASIVDAHIKSLNADKIVAGRVKAEFIEIDGTTTFSEGYDPSIINETIRHDLNLSTALPTQISMSNEGIKATTESDPTKYVLINQNGLYVHNGALIIDGGLTKDQINSGVTSEWDKAAQFVDDMSTDDIITASEKLGLKREWEGWVSENDSLMAMADYYWPDNTTAPFEKTDYIPKYSDLKNYLTAFSDQNNGMPILYDKNMLNDSKVDGSVFNQKINDFKTAKFRLTEKLSMTAKDLADAAQDNIDEVEDNIVYKLEIISTQGNIFKNGQVSTVLEAHVYHGMYDVTDQFDASKFRWTRVSNDAAGDAAWNQEHFGGTKSIQVTRDDVYIRATFNCELLN